MLGARERPRCPFPTRKAGGARFAFILSPPAPANRPCARGLHAAARPSPFGPSRPRAPPPPRPRRRARAPARLAPSRFPPARETPLPFRLAALPRAAIFAIHPDTAGLPPRPPTAGPQLPNPLRFPRSPAGAQPRPPLPPFPLIPLPDAAIMLKPQPPQQTSQPQQPPPTQQAVARRPPGGTSPPNGGLPGPLAASSAPPGPPAAASPCLGPASAAGSGLRRGTEGILAPQPPSQQQQHPDRPGAAAIGSAR